MTLTSCGIGFGKLSGVSTSLSCGSLSKAVKSAFAAMPLNCVDVSPLK